MEHARTGRRAAPGTIARSSTVMTIVQKMRAALAPAMKARDAARTGFLRYWIAQLTLGDGTEMADADAVKKMRSILK
jgi:uncharacterized protein YqeY